jgi:putative methyltransferase (TIGR04325 family)
MKIKSFIRAVIPFRIRYAIRKWVGDITRYSGPYTDWRRALESASGYGTGEILDRVRAAMLQVQKNPGSYEQDSVVLSGSPPPEPLLKMLSEAAKSHPRGLNVLDYGGSLGGLYHRVKPFLSDILIERWYICEQPNFVACGKDEFQTETLRFIGNPVEALVDGPIDILILSSVLPYLPVPLETLQALAQLSPASILIDRTPLSADDNWHLLIQHVPRSIYHADYPLWLIPRHALLAVLEPAYDLTVEFIVQEAPVVFGSRSAPYLGMILNKRGISSQPRVE